MSYRFKDTGPDSIRGDGGRMMGMDDKLARDDMDDLGRGPRPPFGRGRRLSPGRDKPFSERGRDFSFGRGDMSHGRDRSPRRGGFEDRFSDRFKRDDHPFPRRDDMGRKDLGRSFLDEPDPFQEKFMDRQSRFDQPSSFGSRYDMPDDLKPRPFNLPGKGFNKSDMVKPNECEIIIINKLQRAYGENIEGRMKNLGIQVDILFLKDEALLVQTIDDIARRGSLYAMVVSPLNETHRSVTLNILYGTPQEHRNMPLDDALKLVARNFHDHIRSQREIMDRDKLERGIYSGSFPADREIQFLLRLLADGRQLSIGELDTVIKFLTERRDKMKSPHGDVTGQTSSSSGIENNPASQKSIKDDIDLIQKEQDLQNRIMSIMNQGSASDIGNVGSQSKPNDDMTLPGMGDIPGGRLASSANMGNRPPMSGPPIPPNHSIDQSMGNRSNIGQNSSLPNHASQSGVSGSNQSSSTYINFDNPSVKKALDSLMQSGPNLLKSLSGASSITTQSDSSNKGPTNIGNISGPQRGDIGSQGGSIPYPNRNTGQSDGRNMDSQDRNMGSQNNRNMGPPDGRGMGPPDGRDMGPRDGGNMGRPDGRDMGPRDGGNMGRPDGRDGSNIGRNMGPPDSRNMGPPDGRSMGSDNRNMGPGMNSRQGQNFGSNMGPRATTPYQERPGMYGNSNMMGTRPHYMGNQGMGGPSRRY